MSTFDTDDSAAAYLRRAHAHMGASIDYEREWRRVMAARRPKRGMVRRLIFLLFASTITTALLLGFLHACSMLLSASFEQVVCTWLVASWCVRAADDFLDAWGQ